MHFLYNLLERQHRTLPSRRTPPLEATPSKETIPAFQSIVPAPHRVWALPFFSKDTSKTTTPLPSETPKPSSSETPTPSQ